MKTKVISVLAAFLIAVLLFAQEDAVMKRNEFISAICKGDVCKVKSMLAAGMSPKIVDDEEGGAHV